MQLGYGYSYFSRSLGNFKETTVINMIAEEIMGEETPSLISRPGIVTTGVTVGSGPVTAMYAISGVFNDDMFVLSGEEFYRGETLLGEVGTVTVPSIASYRDKVFVCSGARLFLYDGTVFTEITIPEVTSITKVVVGMSRAIVLTGDNQTFYWSEPLETSFDVLAFAEAENSPDKIVDMLFLGDTLHLFGTDTIEFWPSSQTSIDLPFMPLVGRTFQVGLKNQGAACKLIGSFAWITEANAICVGTKENKISTRGLEEKIEGSASARLWTFRIQGLDYLALRLDTQTFVYNTSNSTWSEFKTYGSGNWDQQCFEDDIFGTTVNGTLVRWDYLTFSDMGSTLERQFDAGNTIEGSNLIVNNLVMRLNAGWTSYSSGVYANPVIEMKTSKDGGWTWGPWKRKSLGTRGSFKNHVYWNSVGRYQYPGFFVRFRVTDPVPFRVSYVGVNDPLV